VSGSCREQIESEERLDVTLGVLWWGCHPRVRCHVRCQRFAGRGVEGGTCCIACPWLGGATLGSYIISDLLALIIWLCLAVDLIVGGTYSHLSVMAWVSVITGLLLHVFHCLHIFHYLSVIVTRLPVCH